MHAAHSSQAFYAPLEVESDFAIAGCARQATGRRALPRMSCACCIDIRTRHEGTKVFSMHSANNTSLILLSRHTKIFRDLESIIILIYVENLQVHVCVGGLGAKFT